MLTQGGPFIPHCTPEESAVMGAGPALPALAVSLPTGSSLLISPLLPSRGLLYQSPHRPRSQPSINVRKRSAARETGFDFSLELLPYFNIGFNRRLCLKEITIRSDSRPSRSICRFFNQSCLNLLFCWEFTCIVFSLALCMWAESLGVLTALGVSNMTLTEISVNGFIILFRNFLTILASFVFYLKV